MPFRLSLKLAQQPAVDQERATESGAKSPNAEMARRVPTEAISDNAYPTF